MNFLPGSKGPCGFLRKARIDFMLLIVCWGLAANLYAAIFSDDNWTAMGGYPGADGQVYAAAVDGSGTLYIGGMFLIVGDAFANSIAKWNGTNWSALGSGLQWNDGWGVVNALAISGNDLYAGGDFKTAGDVAANSIAKWNGTNWSTLGSGLAGGPWGPYVCALAVLGSDLYVAGSFGTAGGNPASNIAKWNGSSWSALGSGMDGTVTALAVLGGDLYASGDFTNAGGIMVNRLAKWNGSSWSALGSGVQGFDSYGNPYTTVSALAVYGNELYVAGYFSTAGGIAATNMAKWNGSSWSAFPSPISSLKEPTCGGRVNGLTVSGNDLYAGGDIEIDYGGGASAYGTFVAKWNGSSWFALEPGMDSEWIEAGDPHVYALVVSGTNVYAGGGFRTAGNSTAHCIARWNGSNWSAHAPTYCYLTAVTASGRDVYGAGVFTAADGTQSKYVAKWNTTNWSALGSVFQSDNSYRPTVSALALSGSGLYAAGSFTNAGGTAANRIAKWNGTIWSALGSGLGGTSNSIPTVYALAVSGNDLYVGGQFTSAGGVAATNIAKWNGTGWVALGWAASSYSPVYALAVSGNDVYAGGTFSTAYGSPGNYIAKWDGSSWSALGSGLNGAVYTLAVSGNDLYVGGSFGSAIAKWDGSNWSALGPGMSAAYWSGGEYNTTPYVYALAVSGSDLYVGGYFNNPGDADANFIAKWNGSSWSALGSGMDSGVRLLAASSDELFASGGFRTAGGKLSPYLARARIGSIGKYVAATNSTASIQLSGVTGYQYHVQRATNLSAPIAWTTLTTSPLSPAPDGSFTFTDTNAPPGPAFYRALEVP